ncbi:mycofactocin-coupled SDR family oxidoreductase [Jatrophihabitans sp.]|uniref:mycofactocin-coupled SDR family oxidoreductase n=1 Tax=Jatrophihabitans sp. TaxID=1932789 RepID=UPI0030C74058|nr:short-chain dehydrogenase/reductase [Jatrophihabitans sp.]
MGKLDGQVAFITGAARGQGRSHAVALAAEGADIVGFDLCDQLATVDYPMSTPADLDETADAVRAHGRGFIACIGDVRDRAALSAAVAQAVTTFGRLDIVLANAGVMAHGLLPYEKSVEKWRDTIDINLTGVWNTLQATSQTIIDGGRGGSIVITSSTAGLKAVTTNFEGGFDGYNVAKTGLAALMTSYAGRLAQYRIRVNTIHPTGVATPMVINDFFPKYMAENDDIAAANQNALPVAVIEAADVSNGILYLVSDAGRYITGQKFVIDAGMTTVSLPGSGTTLG